MNVAVRSAIAAVRWYQRRFSGRIGGSCRYVPTCSAYAILAFAQYGAVRGGLRTASRLLRCHPYAQRSGEDYP